MKTHIYRVPSVRCAKSRKEKKKRRKEKEGVSPAALEGQGVNSLEAHPLYESITQVSKSHFRKILSYIYKKKKGEVIFGDRTLRVSAKTQACRNYELH